MAQPKAPTGLVNPLRLLYWVYFKPSALRRHTAALLPEEAQKSWRFALRQRELRLLLEESLLVAAVTPFVVYAVIGLLFTLAGAGFDWGGGLTEMAGGVAFGVAGGVAVGVAVGVAGGVAGGVAFGVAGGVAGGVAFGVAFGVAGGVAGGVAFGAAVGVAFGVAGGVAFGAGALRLPFYLLEVAPAVWHYRQARRRGGAAARLARAPLYFDELLALPQPFLARLLRLALQEDAAAGLREAAFTASNPCQRWAAANALRGWLEEQPDEIFPALLRLCAQPRPYHAVGDDPDEQERQADPLFTTKLLLAGLAGLAGLPPTLGISGLFDRLALALTAPLRRPARGSLAGLARVYYTLLTDSEWSPAYLAAFAPFRAAAHGEETYHTFRTLDTFLACEAPSDLAKMCEATAWTLDVEDPLRPKVLNALRRLGSVAADVHASLVASSPQNRLETLTRAQRGLAAVVEAADRLPPPEVMLLVVAIWRWQGIVGREQDKLLARARPQRIASRYVVGPPLRPESGRLFVGRGDVLAQIERLWLNPYQKTAVLLHGQRRMGKSSILCHLTPRLGASFAPVLADLNFLAAVSSVAALAYNLADVTHQTLRKAGCKLPPPQMADFEREPFVALRRFLDAAEATLDEGQTVAWLLDEFEALEDKWRAGVFPDDLLWSLRSIGQHRSRFALLFAGSHTLEEMAREYWSPFFGAVQPVKVSYLEAEDARQLITEPWEGFDLDYDAEAVERIAQVTGCQPMLLQAVCAEVIEQINRRLARGESQYPPRAGLADVEAALETALAVGYYFDAVWKELAEDERLVLSALGARQNEAQQWVSQAEVERLLRGQLSAEALAKACELLIQRDMLDIEGNCCRFRVELVRRWVRARKPLASPG